MAGPRHATGPSELRVRVSSGLPDRDPDDVFLLALALPGDGVPVPDVERIATFAPLVPTPGPFDQVRVGRTHGLAPGSTVTEDVDVRLGPPAQTTQRELETAVAGVFRTIIDSTPATELSPLDHDAAIAASLSLVCDLSPTLRRRDLSVRAEDHSGGRWAVRISAPGPHTFDVHLGFVDGHPGSTHIHRSRPVEVVDSVGT